MNRFLRSGKRAAPQSRRLAAPPLSEAWLRRAALSPEPEEIPDGAWQSSAPLDAAFDPCGAAPIRRQP